MPSPPVAILCFHRVLPVARRAGPDEPYFLRQTALTLDGFRALLDELERRSAVASPGTLCEWARGGRWASAPRVILTFDDGYADVLEIAAPELKKRGMPALLCVTTGVASGAQEGLPVDHWYAAVHAGLPSGPEHAEDRARLVDGPEKRAFVLATPEEQPRMLEQL